MITKKTLEAQIYSFQVHQHQPYDNDVPYTVHLYMVVTTIIKYLHLIPKDKWEVAIIAAWLHDAREDQGLSYNDIKKRFGEEAAEIVYCLTNNDGRNRKEKAINTYGPKTSQDRIALFDKLGDRLANVEYGLLHSSSMLKVQKEEFPYMVEILFVPGEYDEMWEDLASKLGVISPVTSPEIYTCRGLQYYPKTIAENLNKANEGVY